MISTVFSNMLTIEQSLLFLLIINWCSSEEGIKKVYTPINYRNSFFDPSCDCQIPTNQHQPDANQPLFKKLPLTQSTSIELQFIYPNVLQKNLSDPTISAWITQLICGKDGNNLVFKSQTLPFISSAIVRCAILDNATCTYRLFTPWNHYLLSFKSFSEITCTNEQVPETRIPMLPLPYISCERLNVTCLEIGFPVSLHVSPLGFLPVIKYIAVDVKKLQPVVAHAWMIPSLIHAQNGDGNYTLKKGPIFSNTSIDVKEVYQKDFQRKRFLEIFEDQKLVDAYIPKTGDSYLTEGQLISEKDLFYRAQKASAFFHENIVPIWRDVAIGNWELAGKYLRQLTAENQIGFLYYSGTIDTLELPDQQGNGKKIYLAQGEDGEPVIPVPKLLFKYIVGKKFREDNLRALVLITVNDPRVNLADGDLVKRGYLIPNCRPKSICQTLHPEFADPTKGYTYCCSGQEFTPYAKVYGLPHNSNMFEII